MVDKSEDEPLNAMLPNPYGLNEYPGQGSIQYRSTPKSESRRASGHGGRPAGNKRTNRMHKYGPALKNIIPIRNNRKYGISFFKDQIVYLIVDHLLITLIVSSAVNWLLLRVFFYCLFGCMCSLFPSHVYV